MEQTLYAQEMERIRRMKELQEEDKVRLVELERKQLDAIEMKRQKLERERQRLLDEERQYEVPQERLRQIGSCPNGFKWLNVEVDGYVKVVSIMLVIVNYVNNLDRMPKT
jgi:hypothetical protein